MEINSPKIKPQSLSTIMRLKKDLFEEFQDKEKNLCRYTTLKLKTAKQVLSAMDCHMWSNTGK